LSQRRQQADGTGTGDQRLARLPRRAAGSDPLDLLPGLGDHAGRLQKNAMVLEGRINLEDEIRLDAELLAAVTVALLDAALGVLAVAAHIPFANGAGGARHRIGPPHDANHQIARRNAAAIRRLFDAAERFMADDEALMSGRRPAIMAIDDLVIGAANAERERAHQNRAIALRRRRHIFELNGIGLAGLDGKRAHK